MPTRDRAAVGMMLAGLPLNPDPVLNQPITPELVKKHGLQILSEKVGDKRVYSIKA